jgi:DUF1680 family protein
VAVPSDLYTFETNQSKKIIIKINGMPVDYIVENGYAMLSRTWKKGDMIEMNLPMDVQRVTANEKIKDDAGRIALQRGPLMYCAEWRDNNGKTSNIILPTGTVFTKEYRPTLLNGVYVLKADATALITTEDKVTTVKQPFVAIPYYAWANRGKGEMMMWFPEKIRDVDIITN